LGYVRKSSDQRWKSIAIGESRRITRRAFSHCQVAETWSNAKINGPWDMFAVMTRSGGDLFVSNALNRPKGLNKTPPVGLCTVVRIDVSLASGHVSRITSSTVIGSNFVWRANRTAFIQSPTGVAFAVNGTLYVAETVKAVFRGSRMRSRARRRPKMGPARFHQVAGRTALSVWHSRRMEM
jgi:hypothetical protein